MTTTVSRNPTGDEAVSGTWTGTAGSRYTLVDDYPDTTGADQLIHGTTAGNITFTFSAFSIPSDATNISVAVLYYDAKNGAQNCNVGARLKLGSSYFNSATHNPTNNTYVQRTDTFSTNPATSAAWTVDQVNGTAGSGQLVAFGWSSTDASPTVDLTSIRLDVTYDRDLTLLANVGNFIATGFSAELAAFRKLNAEAGIYNVTGQSADLQKLVSRVLPADSATFSVAGVDAVILKAVNRTLTADSGSFAVTGVEAAVRATAVLLASAAAFSLTGNNADLHYVAGIDLNVDPGHFIVTGLDAALTRSITILASTRAFNIVGRDANVVYSGSQPQTANALRYQHYVSKLNQDIVQAAPQENQLVFYLKGFFRIL